MSDALAAEAFREDSMELHKGDRAGTATRSTAPSSPCSLSSLSTSCSPPPHDIGSDKDDMHQMEPTILALPPPSAPTSLPAGSKEEVEHTRSLRGNVGIAKEEFEPPIEEEGRNDDKEEPVVDPLASKKDDALMLEEQSSTTPLLMEGEEEEDGVKLTLPASSPSDLVHQGDVHGGETISADSDCHGMELEAVVPAAPEKVLELNDSSMEEKEQTASSDLPSFAETVVVAPDKGVEHDGNSEVEEERAAPSEPPSSSSSSYKVDAGEGNDTSVAPVAASNSGVAAEMRNSKKDGSKRKRKGQQQQQPQPQRPVATAESQQPSKPPSPAVPLPAAPVVQQQQKSSGKAGKHQQSSQKNKKNAGSTQRQAPPKTVVRENGVQVCCTLEGIGGSVPALSSKGIMTMSSLVVLAILISLWLHKQASIQSPEIFTTHSNGTVQTPLPPEYIYHSPPVKSKEDDTILPLWVVVGSTVRLGDLDVIVVNRQGKRIPISYRWYKDGKPVDESMMHISTSSTSSFLVIDHIRAEDEGQYSCYRIIGGEEESGDEEERLAGRMGDLIGSTQLRVLKPPVLVTRRRIQTSLQPGSMLALRVAAEGVPAPEYQWRLNGVNIPGARSDTYTVPAVNPSHMGTYTCEVWNIAGRVVWEEAVIAMAASSAPARP